MPSDGNEIPGSAKGNKRLTSNDGSVQLTAIQIRMARAGAGLTIRELAEITGLNKATIVRIEAGKPAQRTTVSTIKRALQEFGAEFHECENNRKVAVSFTSKQDLRHE